MTAIPVSVLAAVIVAAALHAGWNALLKIGLDRFLTLCLLQMASGLLALPGLLFVAPPASAAWPWLKASAMFHIGYSVFLARAYRLSTWARSAGARHLGPIDRLDRRAGTGGALEPARGRRPVGAGGGHSGNGVVWRAHPGAG